MASLVPFKRAIAVDTETTGFHTADGDRPFLTILHPDIGQPVLCWHDLRYPEGHERNNPRSRELIESVLTDPTCIKSYWNAPFDWRMHKALWGIEPVRPWHDGQVAIALMDENAFPYRLKQCAAAYLKQDISSAEAIAIWLATNRQRLLKELGREPNYGDVPWDLMSAYCTDDGKYTIMFEYLLQPELDRLGMRGVFQDEMELTPALVDMQETGCPLDVAHLEDQRVKALGMSLYQQRLIREEFGWCPSIASPKQAGDFMYRTLGIKCADFTEKGAESSGKIALKRWAREYPGVWRLKRARQLEGVAKMCVTLMEAIRKDGRLHPSQNATGARTGRMSMHDPNLQNMTREGTVKGLSIRSAFRPDEGKRAFHLDYKQIEMVDFADYSQDPVMCQAIILGRDIHQETARRIAAVMGHHGVEPDEQQRQQAKTCNFAIIYGSGDETFMDTLNLDDLIERLFTKGEARAIRMAYLEGFPGVGMLKEKVGWQIATKGMVTDRFGRVHRLGREEWYKGINWLVQGGCAHLLKRALARMHRCAFLWNNFYGIFPEDNEPVVKLVIPVHDEVRFDVRANLPEERIHEIVSTMAACMTWDRTLYDIPVRVDCEEEKPDWGHMEKYKIQGEMPWDHNLVIEAASISSRVSGTAERWWKLAPSA